MGSERLRPRDTHIAYPLEELRITGDRRGGTDTLEAGLVGAVCSYVPPFSCAKLVIPRWRAAPTFPQVCPFGSRP